MGGKIDLAGKRFGRLTVLRVNGRSKNGHVMWLCRCTCGAEVTVRGSAVSSGNTRSCGCFQRERSSECSTKHGCSDTRLYNIWGGMLKRTGVVKGANEQVKRDYIDRGITVCDEWKSFEVFKDWSLSNGYSEGLQIDRVNNDAGYCPSNCRWVTPKENNNNRRDTLRLPDGTPLAMFCSEVGIHTRENGRVSNQYVRIEQAYSRRHKIHPELIQKANETILLYRKCVELRKLLDEARQLKQTLNTK